MKGRAKREKEKRRKEEKRDEGKGGNIMRALLKESYRRTEQINARQGKW